MQTKVEIGSATLYLGDCMEYGFPSCHIAVTSPPYNLNKRASGGGTSTRSYEDWYFDDLPEREYQGWQRMVLSRLLDACEGSIFYNHRIRYAWHSRNKFRTTSSLYHPMQWIADFPIWCEIVWNRRGTTGHRNGRCAIADERIFQIGKPHIFNDMGYTTVWDISPEKSSDHVCPFPVEIPSRCIAMATNPGDTVIDPFMGSGTTGEAAVTMGRNFVGYEIDGRAFDIACERLNRCQREAIFHRSN
jgi:DNA modification methylase